MLTSGVLCRSRPDAQSELSAEKPCAPPSPAMDAATFTAASADATSVVRRSSLTLRDISLMRLEGCRAWHFYHTHHHSHQAAPMSLFHSAVLLHTAPNDSETTMGMSYAGPAHVPTLFAEHAAQTPHSSLRESESAQLLSTLVNSSSNSHNGVDVDEMEGDGGDIAEMPQRVHSESAGTVSELCTTCSFVANTSTSTGLPVGSTTQPVSRVRNTSPPLSSDANTSTLAAFSRSEIDEHAVHMRLCRHTDLTTPDASTHFSLRHHDLRDLLLDRVGHNVALTRELLLQQPPTRHHHYTSTTTEDEDEDDVSSERMTPQLTTMTWQAPAQQQQQQQRLPRETTRLSSSSSSHLTRCTPVRTEDDVTRATAGHHKASAHEDRRGEALLPPATSFKTWRFPHFTKVISPSRSTAKGDTNKAAHARGRTSASHRHATHDADQRKTSTSQKMNDATSNEQSRRHIHTAAARHGHDLGQSSATPAAPLPPLSPVLAEKGTMMEHQQLLLSRHNRQHASPSSLTASSSNNTTPSPTTTTRGHKPMTMSTQTRASISVIADHTHDVEAAYQRMLEMVYAIYERRLRQESDAVRQHPQSKGDDVQTRVTATAPGLRGLHVAGRSPSLSMSGAMGRSAGYYSFNRHLDAGSTPQNCRSVATASPFLRKGSYTGTSQASLATTNTTTTTTIANNCTTIVDNTAHLPVDLCAGSQLLLTRCVSRPGRKMTKALLHCIQRRVLLQTTIFLAYTMRRCRDAGTQQDVPTTTATTSTAAPAETTATPPSLKCPSQLPMLVEAPSLPPPSPQFSPSVAGQQSVRKIDTCQTDTAIAGAPPLRFQRTLTRVTKMVRHVHSIDNVEREVDNEEGNLVVRVGMRLMGWLEVVSLLGAGSFGQVFLCKDLRICNGHFVHPAEIDGDDFAYWNCSHAYLPFGECDIAPTHAPLVAVKVVKSVPLFEQQSVLEAEMLVTIGAQTDQAVLACPPCGGSPGKSNSTLPDPPPPDPRARFVAKVLADGVCYGHHCIVMERYGANLYEYVQNNNYRGLPMYHIRSIGRQLFAALSLLHDRCDIIHADIKPENLLLTLNSYHSTASPSSTVSKGNGGVCGDATTATTAVTERSYITLMPGHTIDEDASAARNGAGGVDCNDDDETHGGGSDSEALHASPPSRLMVTATTADGAQMMLDMPAPEPRRVHALMQTSAMLAAAAADNAEGEAASPRNGPRRAVQGDQSDAAVTDKAAPELHIKLIDFSSSCYINNRCYTYIQSRYYRAPEVIVGAAYGTPIDLWSAGCVLAELLLGMPLLAGCSDHHQLTLIEEMIGRLPPTMLAEGTNTAMYYDVGPVTSASQAAAPQAPQLSYTLLPKDDYLARHPDANAQYTRYFTFRTMQELVRHGPLSVEERRMCNGLPPYSTTSTATSSSNHSSSIVAAASQDAAQAASMTTAIRSELLQHRFMLFDLLRRLLHPNPAARPTATQALQHAFFTAPMKYIDMFGLES